MSDNIILCGLPGVGKTETAKRLASQLGWKHVETDACLEQYYQSTSGNKLTCREIYKQVGENSFRELENKMLSQLLELKKSVISIGGGTLNNTANVTILEALGKIVYLKGDLKIIFERLMQKGIPAYLDPLNLFESFQNIAQQRQPIYESVADLHVDIGTLSPTEIATKIINERRMNRGS